MTSVKNCITFQHENLLTEPNLHVDAGSPMMAFAFNINISSKMHTGYVDMIRQSIA